MIKIDLIIDALNGCKGLTELDNVCIAQALAAARELKDAEFKTQQWGNPKYLIEEAVLAEREACAKLCDELATEVGNKNFIAVDQRQFCAKQIRVRGKHE